jgi:hypothetical protein
VADQLQPIGYIAPSDSSIIESNEVIVTGDGKQGPPVVFIGQNNAIVIVASQWVA